MTAMGREFERKYRADSGIIAAIRASFGDFSEIRMETVYYDTLDAALSRRRWMLRRRYENGISVCTLKTPLPDGSRGEWETPCDDIRLAIKELCKLGAPEDLLTLTESGRKRNEQLHEAISRAVRQASEGLSDVDRACFTVYFLP